MGSGDSDRHAARIRALDDSWLAAAARRDLDGMMAIYAPDAQELLPESPPIIGRDSIRHFEPQEITVARSGDLAVVRGTYRFTPDSLTPEQVLVGKFVGVWRHREGDWRLQLNISNADEPAPRP